LFLEGAGWNRGEKRLEESQPKELFYQFPILHVSAISTAKDTSKPAGMGSKGAQDLQNLAKTAYFCPVYKYPKRNDRYLIFRCYLKAESPGAPQNPNQGMTPQLKWKLAAVALLCCKE
jgi:dynein heavy chain